MNLLKKLKIDILFLPNTREIYPNGPDNKIKISSLENKLCGKFRPGHFKAVVDVVYKFIKIIKPKNIYLGEKDMQQLKIIEHFLINNNINTKVIKCKTIREKNGIPYSSRNFLLTYKEKEIGSNIYKLLLKQKNNLIKNKISKNKIKNQIIKLGARKIDYIEILNLNNFDKKLRIFISYYIRTIRLIDNV